MGFILGKNSRNRLKTCHADLQHIIQLAIMRSKVDFGVSEGYRTIKRQKELFVRLLRN